MFPASKASDVNDKVKAAQQVLKDVRAIFAQMSQEAKAAKLARQGQQAKAKAAPKRAAAKRGAAPS